MNLYVILFRHYGGGSDQYGAKCFLLAESDEQVYEWIASQPKTEFGELYNNWRVKEQSVWDEEQCAYINDKDEELFGGDEAWLDSDYEPENYKTRMLRLHGDMWDNDVEYPDSYYGLTLYGWELLKENVTTDYSELIEFGYVLRAVSA